KTGDQYWIGYPTNIDQWVDLNRGPDPNVQGGWCGSPGINQCGMGSPDQPTQLWGTQFKGADIYCCDRFNFSSNFDLLDDNYNTAKLWITETETKFSEMYGQEIPYPIDLIVYGEDGYGVAVSKKGQSYDLINNESGQPPKKLNNIRCQMPQIKPAGSDILAVFLNNIQQFQITNGQQWPRDTGKIPVITYGSQIRLTNLLN